MHKPTLEQLEAVLDTAANGAIAHWCSTEKGDVRKIRFSVAEGKPIALDFESTALHKGWDFYNITPILLAHTIDKLQRGEYEFPADTSTMQQLREEDAKNWHLDAEAADIVIQFAAFGQYIFA